MKFIFFFFYLFLGQHSISEKLHPYHVGSVEFKYVPKEKIFQITGSFFIDDLENSLNAKYGGSLEFQNEKKAAAINLALQKYCSENLKLKTDHQFLMIKYLGYEEDKENVNVFLEAHYPKTPKKIESFVSMLYNRYNDQINIIHFIVNGKRKSQKIAYPDVHSSETF